MKQRFSILIIVLGFLASAPPLSARAELEPLRLAVGEMAQQRLIGALSAEALVRAGLPTTVLPPMPEAAWRAALDRADADLAWRPLGPNAPDSGLRAGAVVPLAPSGVDDRFVIVMRKAIADAYDIETIGDLARVVEEGWRLDFAVDDGFFARADGLKPMQHRYGFEFPRETIHHLDREESYHALAEGEVDVVAGYAGDPSLARRDLTVLEDDAGVFEPRVLTPIARLDAIAEQRRAATVLGRLARAIDTETLRRLAIESGDEPGALDLAVDRFLDDRPAIYAP